MLDARSQVGLAAVVGAAVAVTPAGIAGEGATTSHAACCPASTAGTDLAALPAVFRIARGVAYGASVRTSFVIAVRKTDRFFLSNRRRISARCERVACKREDETTTDPQTAYRTHLYRLADAWARVRLLS
jgi:hypothetical protein